jgi:hypothetical protein
LRVLAAQAEDSCARYVGMVDVTGKQGAEVAGILVGAAAAAFVSEEFDAVNVLEDFGRRRPLRRLRDVKIP